MGETFMRWTLPLESGELCHRVFHKLLWKHWRRNMPASKFYFGTMRQCPGKGRALLAARPVPTRLERRACWYKLVLLFWNLMGLKELRLQRWQTRKWAMWAISHAPSSFLSFLAEEANAIVQKTEQPRERKRQSLRKKKCLNVGTWLEQW